MLMRSLYAACAAVVLALLAGVSLDRAPVWADCEGCTSNACAWNTLPTSTDADASGDFDTSTDGDSDELTISWCFPGGDPIGGMVEMASSGNTNIVTDPEPTYTPSSFLTSGCTGFQEVTVSGTLIESDSDGNLRTTASIGAAPGCSTTPTHDLAVNHF